MRVGAGVALLTLVEGLAGVGLIATTVPGVVPIGVAGVAGLATVAVVLVSTTAHLLKLRSLRRARDESSGARLYTSITYGVDEPAADVSAAGPVGGADEPEVDAAGPGLGAADVQASAAEPEAEPEAVDPITAALQSGHFDEDAFLKSRSPEQEDTPGDGEPSTEQGGPDE